MTPSEFAIVLAALRIGMGFDSAPFRHQIRRLIIHLERIGDHNQADKLMDLLDPPPNPYPDAKMVLSDP